MVNKNARNVRRSSFFLIIIVFARAFSSYNVMIIRLVYSIAPAPRVEVASHQSIVVATDSPPDSPPISLLSSLISPLSSQNTFSWVSILKHGVFFVRIIRNIGRTLAASTEELNAYHRVPPVHVTRYTLRIIVSV